MHKYFYKIAIKMFDFFSIDPLTYYKYRTKHFQGQCLFRVVLVFTFIFKCGLHSLAHCHISSNNLLQNLFNREIQREAKEEETAWNIKLKHVEVEEQKSPSPEVTPKPPSPEIERLEYHPAPKRERPEVSSGTNCLPFLCKCILYLSTTSHVDIFMNDFFGTCL